MRNFPEISLEKDWLYYFAENTQSDYSQPKVDDSAWIPLPEISDWVVANSAKSGSDWFRRHVTLEPVADCVRYTLHIDTVPETLAIYVNGKKVGDARTKQTFKVDVTDYVALGENVLAMRLTPRSDNAGGGFDKIRLQPAACE
jgi:hypothetical protein